MNAQAYVEERAGEQGEDDKWRTQLAKQVARLQRAQDEHQARLARKQDELQATLASIMDKLSVPTHTVEAVAARDPGAAAQASGTRAPAIKKSGWLYKRSNVRPRIPPPRPWVPFQTASPCE